MGLNIVLRKIFCWESNFKGHGKVLLLKEYQFYLWIILCVRSAAKRLLDVFNNRKSVHGIGKSRTENSISSKNNENCSNFHNAVSFRIGETPVACSSSTVHQ